MSDTFNFVDLTNLNHALSVSNNHCLNYVRKQCVSPDEIILTIHIKYDCLRKWYEERQRLLKQTDCTYIQILNFFLGQKHAFKVKDDCTRIEGRLRRVCAEIKHKFEGTTGSCYRTLLEKDLKLAVRINEIVSASELEWELKNERRKAEELLKNNDILTKRCEDLYNKMIVLEAKEKEAGENLADASAKIDRLLMENEELHSYIETLGQKIEFRNSGGKIAEVGQRQQRRKLKELKTNVEKALWFAKTFGLTLDSVVFFAGDGSSHTLAYNDSERKSFKDLSEDDQVKIRSVLYVLDKFCIGDAAYHELTMTPGGEDLPRSYLIKQCKEDMNSLCHIERTPGVAPGAQLDFVTELESVVKNQIHQNKIDINNPDLKLDIKISGDGARMSKQTSFIVVSFSLLNNNQDAMSSKGNHAIAVIKGQESYDLLQSSCATLFKSINDLIDKGKISIEGKDVPVELFLGGDYKFLLLVLGMKSATSDFACIWCKIHKKNRFDVTKTQDYYWGDQIARTVDDVKEDAKKKKHSCQHQPLLNIPLENVVLDELHLMLRITDKLTKSLIMDALLWDNKDNIGKPPSQKSDKHRQDIVKAIKSCGVSFNVWEKMNGDGSASGHIDFTSLMGSDKKLLLKHLTQKLQGVIKQETSDTVIQIWKDFDELYTLLGQSNPTDEQVSDYFTKACNWVTLFSSLGGICYGYEKERITPYMHAMVYHIPRFMCKHNGIKKFTGQGVEKLNDDCRRIHLQRSNKWDAPKDVLLVGKRLEHLSEYERNPRQYHKHEREYWNDNIRENRAKRFRLCSELLENTAQVHAGDIEDMTAEEIKKYLKDMGITTRVRSLKKLQELLKKTLTEGQNPTEPV